MDKISKSQIKLVRSLQQKKFRDETGCFVAEGAKCVDELCKGFELVYRIQTDGYEEHPSSLLATPTEIEQMSSLRTPQGVIGVFRKPSNPQPVEAGMTQEALFADTLVLALDGIQDPGNLGTIIRTCDWFGVHDIVCSLDTADCFNPKVVQATMGALARVRVHYVDLPKWLKETSSFPSLKGKVNIYGTLLDGDNMYKTSLPFREGSRNGLSVIIMGNEGNGISPEVRPLITNPIRIPSYPENAETSESLNVSIATAIVLAEFRR